jgi:hypothetical protein
MGGSWNEQLPSIIIMGLTDISPLRAIGVGPATTFWETEG